MSLARTSGGLFPLLLVGGLLLQAAPASALVGGAGIPPATLAPGGAYEWLVRLEGPDGRCSGALIAAEWVLTAGHCQTATTAYVGDDTTGVAIVESNPHPSYLEGQIPFDAALLRLASPSLVRPVALARATLSIATGDPVVLAGWGVAAAGGSAAEGPRAGTTALAAANSTTLAAQAPVVGCNGDSGGPILWRGTLIGLMSAADATCAGGSVGPRFSSLAAWVTSIAGSGSANRPPLVPSGERNVVPGSLFEIPLEFTDPEGWPLTFDDIVSFTFDEALLSSEGCHASTPPTLCTFLAPEGFIGDTTISYRVSDGQSTATATWVIHIGPSATPTAPVAQNVELKAWPGVPRPIALTATDANLDPLTTSIVTPPVHGTLADCGPGSCVYTADSSFVGDDSFAFAASDGVFTSNVATVSIRVLSAPPDQALTTAGQTPLIITLDPTEAAFDQVLTSPEHGSLNGSEGDPRHVYEADPGFVGVDQFTWRARLGQQGGFSPAATVTVTVLAAGTPACQPGTWSANGHASPDACTPATAGHFVASQGATAETPCAPGTFQPLSGQPSCLLAEPGFFVPVAGSPAQTACAPGFTSDPGATDCPLTVDLALQLPLVTIDTAVDDRINAVLASGGRQILAGRVSGDFGGETYLGGVSDGFIQVRDASGAIEWTRLIGTALEDSVEDAAVDDAGNVYVAGMTTGLLGVSSDPDFQVPDGYVAKYSPAGDQLWLRPIYAYGTDHVARLAVSAAGDVAVSGTTGSTLAGNTGGVTAAFLLTYDTDGTRGPSTSSSLTRWGEIDASRIGAIGLGEDGSIYAVGPRADSTFQAFSSQSILTRFAPHLGVTWTLALPWSVRSLAVRPDGGVVLAGASIAGYAGPGGNNLGRVAGVSAAGVVEWMTSFGVTTDYDSELPMAVTVQQGGNIYAAGMVRNQFTGGMTWNVWAFRRDGSLLATGTPYGDTPAGTKIITDLALQDGTLSVAGYAEQGFGNYPKVGFLAAIAVPRGAIRCSPGTWSANGHESPDACVPAAAGHFVALAGATAETACAAGTFQPLSAQTACELAPPGHFVDAAAAVSAVACEPGTFQAASGSVSCEEAAPGTFVAGEAATAAVPCEPGSFQPSFRQSSCVLAAPGYFVAESGATEQSECAPGFTSNLGAVACFPSASVAIGDVFVTEGNGTGTKAMTFTVTRTGGAAAVTFAWTTADGSAVADLDYVPASGVATIPEGGSGAVTLTVLARGDAMDEYDETLRVLLSAVTGAYLEDGEGVGTILDNDAEPRLVMPMTFRVSEGVGTVTARVGLTAASGKPVSLVVATEDVAASPAVTLAIAGSDYVAVSPSALTIAPGALQAEFPISIVDDALDEVDQEVFAIAIVSSENAAPAVPLATVTIYDDDVQPRLLIQPVSVPEGDEGQADAIVSATLSAPSGRTVTASLQAGSNSTAAAGSDYVFGALTLTFAPGETEKTLAVPIIGDRVNEGDEHFTLFATASGGQGGGSGRITIVDDDPLPTLAIDSVTVTEGDDGSSTAVFTVTLTPASGRSVRVQARTRGVSAAPDDIVVPAATTLSFPAGETVRTFAVQVAGDRLSEADETFEVALTNATGATLGTAVGVGTIVDDDPLPALSISDATVLEPDGGQAPAVFTVTLVPASGRTVSVVARVDPGSAGPSDLALPAPILLTFPPGTTTKTFTVRVIGDLYDEDDEAFTARLTDAVAANVADESGAGLVLDNDDPPTVGLGATLRESAGEAAVTVTLSRASGKTVTLGFESQATDAAPFPAYALLDYRPLPPTTLTFAPGVTEQSLPITNLQDDSDEENETFLLRASSGVNVALPSDPFVVTILDDDGPPLIYVLDTGPTGESDGRTVFRVVVAPASAKTVTVNYRTVADTAAAGRDYVATSGQLVFEPHARERDVVVELIDDPVDEIDERLRLEFSEPVNGRLRDPRTSRTIIDDDPAPLVSVADATVTEGDSVVNAVFTVSLSAPSEREIRVTARPSPRTAAPPLDYSEAHAVVVFPPGTTTGTFAIPIQPDRRDEPDETFVVSLSNPINATIAVPVATGTIVDDDPAPSVSINSVALAEPTTKGSGTLGFTLGLSAPSGQTVTVSVSTADGTAHAPADYTARGPVSISFLPGQTTRTFTVTVKRDALVEGDETVLVVLSDPTNAAIGVGTGIGTILGSIPPEN